MPNQMIALSGRPASIPSPASMTQRYMGMMNAVAQQRAAERQAAAFQMQQARTTQEMDFAAQQRAEQARAAELQNEVGQVAYFRELSMPVRDDATYQMWLGQVAERNPQWAAMIRQASPTYDPSFMTQLRADAEQFVNKTIATPTAEVVFAPGGEAFEARIGGTGAPTAREVTVVPPEGAPVSARSAPTNVENAFSDPRPPVNARAANGANTGPQDLLDQGVNPASIPMGSPLQSPINFVPGSSGQQPTAPLTMESAPQIIQAAVQNRTIDESHLQQLRQMVGPENEQALAQWMQQNGVRITPAGQPAMRSAVYRPGQDAAPQMTQVQQAVNAPGTQFRGRDPLQSPSQVPSSAGAVTGANTAASEGVRVQTQPRIVAGEERARRIETLRAEAPRAQSDVDAFLSNTNSRIAAIDRMLNTRSYESIVGSLEGWIPRGLGGERRNNAIRNFELITNTDVLQDILASRAQTETGGSPVGNVSNADLQFYIRGANALERTGSEAEFRRELINMRQSLVRGAERARRTYDNTFRDLGDEMTAFRLSTPPPPRDWRISQPTTNRRSLDDL